MAKITFGQITLEDANLNLNQLVEIYRGLFKEDEFILPLISNVADVEEEDIELLDDDEEEVEEVSQPAQASSAPQAQAQPTPQPTQTNPRP
jgi:lipopolysaccharide biosynthesis regulator YciM